MKYILSFMAGGVIFGLFAVVFLWYLDLPTKAISTATGKCVYVLTPEGKKDCSFVVGDKRYRLMWVP